MSVLASFRRAGRGYQPIAGAAHRHWGQMPTAPPKTQPPRGFRGACALCRPLFAISGNGCPTCWNHCPMSGNCSTTSCNVCRASGKPCKTSGDSCPTSCTGCRMSGNYRRMSGSHSRTSGSPCRMPVNDCPASGKGSRAAGKVCAMPCKQCTASCTVYRGVGRCWPTRAICQKPSARMCRATCDRCGGRVDGRGVLCRRSGRGLAPTPQPNPATPPPPRTC